MLERESYFLLVRYQQDVTLREFVQDFARISRAGDLPRISERLTYGIHDGTRVSVCNFGFAELGHSHRKSAQVVGGVSWKRRLLQGDPVLR